MDKFTHSITITGITREVEFWLIRDDYARSVKAVGKFCKGPGNKHWAHHVEMFRGGPKGEAWRLGRNALILNRNGYNLIGWADSNTYPSQHNSAS